MNTNTTYSLADEYASALDWWRDAGVEWHFADTPQSWLKKEDEASTSSAAASSPSAATSGPDQAQSRGQSQGQAHSDNRHSHIYAAPDTSNWPQNLEDFRQWWLNTPDFTADGGYPRIAPHHGSGQAELMIIVPVPEACDQDRLLSGEHGTFLGNMLRAMGIALKNSCIASVLPRHTPHPDWHGAEAVFAAEVLRHHLMLVRPARALIFGMPVLPLLGHDPAQKPASFREIRLKDSIIPAMAALDLDTMLERPRLRARFWQRWLEWTDTPA